MSLPAPAIDAGLVDRHRAVDEGISEAIAEAGRESDDVTRIVVTKFHPAQVVRQLHTLGVRNFGENRHQDAAPKSVQLNDLGLSWHFVGQLQSKKVRAVLGYATVIHSVDRSSLVDALAAATADRALTEAPVQVFLQLNLTDDSGRGGVKPADLLPLAEDVLAVPSLELLGLMAVAPLGSEPQRAFARVRASGELLQTLAPTSTSLSMGMSSDYRAAILEGATHLRIGTAITGNRPEPG